jgi:hypothetical protein
MRKLFCVLVILLNVCWVNIALAQNTNPNYGIFFQAVARDNFSNPAKDRVVFVESSILQFTANGTKVLTELHQTTTDGLGVFSINIGSGQRIGGTLSGLDKVDWANGPYYLGLKIAIKPLSPVSNWDYTKELIDLGASAFGTVPYAYYAGNSAGVKDVVKTTDTAAMLLPYAKSQTLLALGVNKLNVADSISKYVTPTQLAAKTFDSTAIYNQLALKANSASVTTSLATKLNIADSITKYVTPTQLASKTFDSTAIYYQLGLKANNANVTTALNTKENLTNKSTDVSLDSTSDIKYPSVKAIKTYVDGSIVANTTPLTFAAPLSKSGLTVSIPQANSSVNGYLNASDWTSFNNKIDASQKAANNGVATLGNDGKIPSNQIPSISFQSATVVASQAAMLSIAGAQVGSIAIRTDNNKNYVLSNIPSTTLSNWIELATPNSVTSVNGFAGPNVVLTTNDVNEGSTNKYYTDARVRGAISATAPMLFNSSNGAFSITQASITTDGFLSATDWNIFNNKQNALTAGTDYVIPSQITLASLGAEAVSNKSNNILADSASTTKYPSVKMIKDYVDQQSANAGVADNSISTAKISGSISINKGGTGATTAVAARANLGLVIGTDVMAANATTTLTGDVAGSGNGSFATTVNSVGGVSSSTIATLPTTVASNTVSITANATAITAEATTARAAEQTLTTNLTALTTTVNANTASITSNASAIAAEATTARAAEQALSTSVNANTASITANTASINNLTTSVNANTASITANATAITAEATTARAAEQALTNNVNANTASITANTASINNLTTSVNANTASITANATAIAAEATTARAAEQALTNNVNANTASITANIASINTLTTSVNANTASITANAAAVAAEATTARAAEQTLTTNLTALTTTVNANTASITANASSITTNTADILLKAPIASPTFTGTPSAPTPATIDNSTKIATTEYVKANLSTVSAGTLTGTTLASTITGSSLTSVGTITSGVWSGTAIALANGGTGATTATGALTNLGAEPSVNKSFATDLGNSNPSDVLFPSQKAVKAYVDAQAAAAGVADGSITNAKLAGSITASKLIGTDISTVGTITSGTWSGTTIAIANGGTSATTVLGAKTNLGLNNVENTALSTWTGSTNITSVGNLEAVGKTFMFQDLVLGYGTTFGKISTDGGKYISMMPFTGVESTRFWPSGNVTIQHGGTYIDNGYTLEVGGTTNITGNTGITGNLNVTGNITGGTWSGTTIGLTKGGTGATTAAGARTNLGLEIGTDVMAANYTTTLTGDVTGAGNGSFATTLANSGVTSGTYGSSIAIPVLTVDTKGRVTAASTVGIVAGVNSLNYTSATSYAAGGTISGTSLTLAAADATNPGLISTGAQTIAGAKTFFSDVAATNFLGNATTSTTAGNITATSNTTLTSLSNLAAVGTITSGVWSGTAIANNKLANSSLTVGSTNIALGATTSALAGLSTVTSTNFTGDLTGNASTATKLSATRNINGVAFDGSANITIAADANTLTGTTLASNVVTSSLTTVGTITSGVWSGTAIANNKLANSSLTVGSTNIALGATTSALAGLSTVTSTNFTGDLTGNASTATKLAATKNINGVAFDGSANITIAADANTLTGTTLASNVVTSSLTTVGTITSGVWSGTAIAVAKGGTGATTKTAAFDALSPMTTAGDIVYGGASGSGTRLAAGSNGQVLTMVSGNPAWQNSGGSIATMSATGNATTTASYIIFTGSTASQTITIPSAVTLGAGRELTIKNVASVTVSIASAGGFLIQDNSTTSATSAALGIEPSNNWMKLVSDGTNWYIFRALF